MIPKGAAPAVATQSFEELEAAPPSAAWGEGSSESEVVSSCAPPQMVKLPPPEPDEPPAAPEVDEVEWDESLLHEGALGEGGEHEEGPLNAPALSQAAREMARDVRAVPISYAPLLRYILSRPLDCAYLLGYLTPEYMGRCRAFVYEEPRADAPDYVEVQALLFEYTGLSVPTVWTFGGTLEVEAIIAHAYGQLPRRVYFNLEDHHLQAVRTHYAVRNRKPTLRMGLRRPHYRPASSPEGVVMLSHKDTGGIMRLYAQYPDHLFEPAQLDTGLYCGVRDAEGQLVSVAGIHLLNQELNIAAIGNIVTDKEHRGRGLATRCVRVLLDELFKGVENVALNVTEDNRPAIACYEKFGFRTTSRIIEAWAKLR
ncbi:MAG: GNAT family N-acetyltransferase [Deltaproteobacteria bacterium]|nr:GNAT family N-acetyltransferase [Deltaproteobacteria bacterium]